MKYGYGREAKEAEQDLSSLLMEEDDYEGQLERQRMKQLRENTLKGEDFIKQTLLAKQEQE